MNYLSVCSGIEAATVAWHPLGWTPVGFAEIDGFASAVLAARFGSNLPGEALSRNGVPNFGDFTVIDLGKLGAVDLLVGGTPCQAFSFAGRRLSLADARGNLTLAYAVLAHELARSHGLKNALWENVPGVLSTDDNAFGCFLGALVGADDAVPLPRGAERWPDAGMVAGPRARAAWRLLDAQYFGLAQRRERVFVVVDFGEGADPAAVLFEPQSLQGNSPPSREEGEGITAAVAGSLTSSGRGVERPGESRGQDPVIAERLAYGGGNRSGPVDVAATITAKGQRIDFEVETFVAHAPVVAGTLGSDHGNVRANQAWTDRLIAHAPETAATLTRGAESAGKGGYAGRRQEDDVNVIAYVQQGWAVRRLTTVECARLQGFPDHHSRIVWRGKPAEQCPDGPQYKTYGNSMAVAAMAWLGLRIAMVSEIARAA